MFIMYLNLCINGAWRERRLEDLQNYKARDTRFSVLRFRHRSDDSFILSWNRHRSQPPPPGFAGSETN